MMRDRILLRVKNKMEKEFTKFSKIIWNFVVKKLIFSYKTAIFPQFSYKIYFFPNFSIKSSSVHLPNYDRIVKYLHTCGFMNLFVLIESIECKQAINADCLVCLKFYGALSSVKVFNCKANLIPFLSPNICLLYSMMIFFSLCDVAIR